MDPDMSGDQVQSRTDEWTVVPRGKRRNVKPAPKAPGVDRDLTLDKLLAGYEYRMRSWQASTCRRQLLQILDRKQPDGGWQIQRAICIASGSFCRDNWECQRRTMTQFAAFMDIVKHLQVSSGNEIRVHAQELVYTPLDIEFLLHLNVTAYDTSDGNQLLKPLFMDDVPSDSHCFVFEAFLDKVLPAVKQLLCSSPKLLVGTSSPIAGAAKTTDEDYQRMIALYKDFNAKHSFYHFPIYEEEPNVFEGLRIYWIDDGDND